MFVLVLAVKTCTTNGTWYKDDKSGLEWSNYTTCLNMDVSIKLIILIDLSICIQIAIKSVTIETTYIHPLKYDTY